MYYVCSTYELHLTKNVPPFIWYVCILMNVNSGAVKAIVADVIMGYHGKNQTKQPVMRQQNNQSDFSLDEFITQTIKYHARNKNVKIIKLNFTSFDAVPPSISILLAKQKEVSHCFNRLLVIQLT